jgi:predicted alpha/beta superfamily hydrolase
VYLLDANATFGTLVEAIRMRCHRPTVTGVVPSIVVGIGSAVDGPYDRPRRTADFAEPSDLRFADLLEELKQTVEAGLDVDSQRRVLIGHSLGGLFVVRLLLERPDSFGTYVTISPSLWWDWDGLVAKVGQLSGRLQSPINVFVAIGEYEETLAPWQVSAPNADEIARRRSERQMVTRARAFAGRLGELGESVVRISYEEFAGEDHASVVPMAISRALRFALPPREGDSQQ